MNIAQRLTRPLTVIAIFLSLAACGEAEEPATVLPRPVLYTIVEPQAASDAGFTGTVEPRYSTDLAFRVLGRLISRPVHVGDLVKKGEAIAMLDPAALDLAVQSARADLASAEAQYTNAAASEERQRILLKSNNIAQAIYDAARQTRDSAEAGLKKARAGLRKAQDQRGYAQLQSDFDGVVSAVQAEVGQVVAAGQPVLTVARPDIREAVVDVPDQLGLQMEIGTRFSIQLQADLSVVGPGVVREISPQADAVTRLRRAKIALINPDPGFRLGATVRVIRDASEKPTIVLPLSALLERDGEASVWLADPHTQQVHLSPVQVVLRTATGFVATNIAIGSYVIIAGVHQLSDGQKVRLDMKGNHN